MRVGIKREDYYLISSVVKDSPPEFGKFDLSEDEVKAIENLLVARDQINVAMNQILRKKFVDD